MSRTARADGASRARWLLLAAALVSLGSVAVALVSQHVFDMQPCPWCVLQRALFVAVALAALTGALIGFLSGWPQVARISAAVVALLALCGAAAALWQHFVAAASASCKLTLADRIMTGLGLDNLAPQVFAAYASCADGAVRLAGVPYEFYSLALFIALLILAVRVWVLQSASNAAAHGGA
jgi:protein dithiol:quinone oxidoreductase